MLRLVSLGAIAAVLGCAPEVLIAHTEQTGGSAGAPSAGSGGGGVSGGGAMPTLGDGGEAGEAAVPARILADSVADFSLTQGEHGWYYAFDDGTLDTFALMTRKSVITTYLPPTKDVWDCWANDETHWVQIFQLGAHANGTDTSPPSMPILQRAVRRWVSTYAGDVVLTGEVAKIDVAPMSSNGVDALVYVDGALLYTTFIGGVDGGGLSYEVNASVKLGSSVDFVLDPHDGDDHNDLSRFTAVITRSGTAPVP
jgi:hypothetical protein